jgi:NADH-quinone oxidoreductase subunit C
VRAPAPRFASNDGIVEAAQAALGAALVDSYETAGEIALVVDRTGIVPALTALRDTPGLEYQQLMDIAGVDYPDREERFEVVYCLLSLTRNHRLHVHVKTDEEKAVPSVVALWPNAGWYEREVFDMYGVLFSGNPDLRRILTDYGFKGHPQRKDFPLSGYVEMRYSEESKRVVYEPVNLTQDFRTFDFMSPWEGAEYVLPGDEKVAAPANAPVPAPAPAPVTPPPPPAVPEEKGAPTPLSASEIIKADAPPHQSTPPNVAPGAGYGVSTDTTKDTGAGKADPDNKPEEKPKDPDVVPTKGAGQNQ